MEPYFARIEPEKERLYAHFQGKIGQMKNAQNLTVLSVHLGAEDGIRTRDFHLGKVGTLCDEPVVALGVHIFNSVAEP